MHVPGVVYLMKRSELGLAACAWVAGGVCFGLGTNYSCRICPRLPATTDLLALAGTRRSEVQGGGGTQYFSPADSRSAEWLIGSGWSTAFQIRSQK
jgi:hypothetical protein